MGQTIRSRMYEGARLTLDQLQAVALPLYAILSSGTTSGQDSYTVPNSKRFIVTDLLPHVATKTPSSESDGFGIFQNDGTITTLFHAGSPRDRLFAKAMNARCNLEYTNTNFMVFDKHTFALSDIMGPHPAIDARLPLVVPPGGQLNLSVSLQDSDAAGTGTQYGVLVCGALVPVEE